MNGITAWMEKYLVPVAAKIGSQKHLVALRDAFIGMLPLTLAGAFATLISAIVGTFPQSVQQLVVGGQKFIDIQSNHPDQLWTLVNVPVLKQLNAVAGLMNTGTLTVIGLLFAFSWGYNLSRAYKVNDLAGGLLGVATLIAGLPNALGTITSYLADSKLSENALTTATGAVNQALADSGYASWKPLLAAGQLDAGAYFTVMIMVAISVIIYAKLMLADITIKMPDSVPPAVSKAFLAIIPTIAGLFVVSVIYYIFQLATNQPLIYLIGKYIAQPFQAMSQNIISVLIATFFVSLLWFFGIHGPNVLAPALDGIWGPLGLDNMAVYQKVGLQGVQKLVSEGATSAAKAIDGNHINLWVRGSWDAFAWFGGSGGTITLVLAILILSKRKDYKMVARLGLAPGIFEINEPVLFGLPIVLNPIFIIPFIVAPIVAVVIAYIATVLQLVTPVVLSTPWVTPPIMNAFLATGLDWRAIVLTIINLVITFFIWAPFVVSANKLEEVEAEAEEAVLD
ncbi:PTS sugar transporter subunit IIC [Lactovum odontotermitis]